MLGVWGNWAPQTTVRTEHDGRFSATINKNCAPRQFMIKARFHDPELEIRHAQAAQDPLRKKVKWYKVYQESGSDSGQGDVNETLTLRFSRAGDLALDDREPWYHAEIWSLYKTAIDQMASYGSRMEFEKQFAVKYPHNVNRNSYARPVNIPAVGLDVSYLVKNSGHDAGQDIEIMLHELMHIWAYQHSIMEDQMAYHLVEEFAESVVGGDAPSTHGMVDHSYVAWHEGFAEWAMEIVAKEISPNRSDTHEPWSTAALSSAGASTFDEVDRLDDGWYAIFNLMHQPDVWEYDFSTTADRLPRTESRSDIAPFEHCAVGRLTFDELLAVIDRKNANDIHAAEMDWRGFMTTVAQLSNGVSQEDIDAYGTMVDPGATMNEILSAMCSRGETLPDVAADWVGTYSGRNDGRRARLTIERNVAGTALKLRFEGFDRGADLSGTISAAQLSDGPSHILEGVRLTGSAGGGKTFERLYLHNDPKYISGFTLWNGTNYGVAFSEDRMASSVPERGRLNRDNWVSEWYGRYEGRLDGRKARLEITAPSDNELRMELRDVDRGMVFTKAIDVSEAGRSPAHVLQDVTLTTSGGDTKTLERLLLHTWNTNYISGHTEWRGTDYGNFFVRTGS